jgi:hypothetical protein
MAIKCGTQFCNFVTDALGSTIGLTDSTGAFLTTYTYDPFGNTTLFGTATSSSYQYTGRENDTTGLFFYRARYYNPWSLTCALGYSYLNATMGSTRVARRAGK